MKIRVLAFAGVREILGTAELEVELAEGAGLPELRTHLGALHPEMARYWGRLAMAVDGHLGEGAPALEEGSEVALLPPVSGGNTGATLVDGPIDIDHIASRVATDGRGAVLTFQGTVRDSHDGRRVTHLVYDAYRPMAQEALGRIARELQASDDNLAVVIVHRLGEVRAGETSVLIAVASPHREAAYQASRTALERLKREVPIWKCEYYAEGDSEWREEEPLAAPSSDSTARL